VGWVSVRENTAYKYARRDLVSYGETCVQVDKSARVPIVVIVVVVERPSA